MLGKLEDIISFWDGSIFRGYEVMLVFGRVYVLFRVPFVKSPSFSDLVFIVVGPNLVGKCRSICNLAIFKLTKTSRRILEHPQTLSDDPGNPKLWYKIDFLDEQ